MARKKVQLRRIENDSARRATFKKRKKGLMKKVSELKTLCAVEACAIVYGPHDSQPEVWPSLQVAYDVVKKFRSMPEIEQSKKMMNQEDYLRQTILKLREKVRKQQRENREYEITQLMYNGLTGKVMHGIGSEELSDLSWLVNEKVKRIRERIEGLRRAMPIGGCVQEAIPPTSLNVYETIQPQPQRPPWLMEVNNPLILNMHPSHEQYNHPQSYGHQHQSFNGYFGGGDDHLAMMPCGDNSAYWSNAFFHGQF